MVPGSESSLWVCSVLYSMALGLLRDSWSHFDTRAHYIESCTFDFRPTSFKTWPVTGKLSLLGSMEFRVGVESGQQEMTCEFCNSYKSHYAQRLEISKLCVNAFSINTHTEFQVLFSCLWVMSSEVWLIVCLLIQMRVFQKAVTSGSQVTSLLPSHLIFSLY